jgi:hypothetical protein
MDIVLPGQGLLGVSGPDDTYNDAGGVRIRPFDPWPYTIVREVTINTPLSDAIIRTGMTQLGKPFDHDALYAFFNPFGVRRDWKDLAKWFCSEWFIWSCVIEKLFGYKLCVPMDMVNPNDTMLILNPVMSPEDIEKLLS